MKSLMYTKFSFSIIFYTKRNYIIDQYFTVKYRAESRLSKFIWTITNFHSVLDSKLLIRIQSSIRQDSVYY